MGLVDKQSRRRASGLGLERLWRPGVLPVDEGEDKSLRVTSKERMIKLKRVYEDAEPDDGARFLVERLWPRGMKERTEDGCLGQRRCPSNELRK